MRLIVTYLLVCVVVMACNTTAEPKKKIETLAEYFAGSDTGVQAGGVKMMPISTPVGSFKVWTKRIGNNPTMKLLLLHGGPAMTHEYFECFESYFPRQGIEVIEYDQLG